MNAFERVQATVALEMPDRIPLSPLLDHWAAVYAGITNADLMTDPEKRIRAVLKTATDFQWDMTYLADFANAPLLRLGVPARLRQPGRELPDNSIHQFDEQGFMKAEDYDLLEAEGFFPFLERVMVRVYPEMTLVAALEQLVDATATLANHIRRVLDAGIVPSVGFVTTGAALEYLSIARGMTECFMDLRRRPEKIKKAAKLIREAFAGLAIDAVNQNGIKRVFLGCSRSSPTFISPRYFEEFVLPDYEFYVDAFSSVGITTWFHFDTNWEKCLHYFRRFPRGTCLAEFDSATNLRKAKEILGDTMAVKGDVPATLLAAGTKDEVLAYCKSLIEEVGKGGGFILGSGCSIPANAKTENVRALTEAVQNWGWY